MLAIDGEAATGPPLFGSPDYTPRIENSRKARGAGLYRAAATSGVEVAADYSAFKLQGGNRGNSGNLSIGVS